MITRSQTNPQRQAPKLYALAQVAEQMENSETLSLIKEIDDHRFCFGHWTKDLDALKKGNSFNDSRIRDYILKLENLVQHLKVKHNLPLL